LFIANCSAGARGDALPPVGDPDEASPLIVSLSADLIDIGSNHNSDRSDD